ncbi:hypothetical protein BABINDRAFT_159956 [Babjeviella inositovora NRRL Y-12698]|uniref:Uncharacterized protein n=1 Tax=Babjeviella inositovora NRRL Y-12698 TaxID=984486 RepID=A0A1E3QX94_9ASCO|nr:uncharacterized protein BABINDRAFT_159956 [Babjeviella inositovora NRRL Y-12698]ODQ81702.1 hypothetical protein BABINDRAFT_159956 [Babjeviella inositovora NRRL Y-12698]
MFSLLRSCFSGVKPSPFASPVSSLTHLTKRFTHEYAPRYKKVRKQQKGRVPVRIGGSTKGSSVEFGTYGLRLKSVGVRLSALQLKEADSALMKVIRPTGAQVFRRMSTNVAVCTKGNETRMGKGKGAFDYWAVRVPTGKVLFEISDKAHEKVARDACRKAWEKLPGVYEFVKLGDVAKIGLHEYRDGNVTVNHFEKMETNPTREYLNLMKSKMPEYRLFRNR